MIDHRVLKHYGTTNSQLRTFFTARTQVQPGATPPTSSVLTASSDTGPRTTDTMEMKSAKFKKLLTSYIEDGRRHCFRNYRHFASTDLLRDSQPNLPENVPLMAYAQGKIDVKTAEKELTSLSCADKFIETKTCETNTQEVKKVVNFARLQEVCFDVARSYIARRANAQNNKYNSLRPFFQFQCRGTRLEDHLKGEVMSQYGEVMVDQYNYRHEHEQAVHAMFYARTVVFPSGAWDVETQTHVAPDNFNGEAQEVDVEGGGKLRLVTRVEREGVKMVRPNPARVIYDTSKPLSGINTNTGPRWIGFFDVQRFGDIATNPDFFNKEAVAWSRSGASILDQNRAYFDLIFAGQPLNFPKLTSGAEPGGASVDLAAQNERASNAYLYSVDSDDDKAVFVTDLRVRVVPKDWGMGEYPHPIWLRVLVASDDTVVFAEWLPSLPGIYFGHNEDDTRLLNITMAHELMPWQDQLSNIMSQLLMKMKHALFRVMLINTDVVPKAIVDKFRSDLDTPKYYINPHLLEVSFNELGRELGLDLDKIFRVVGSGEGTNANESEYINNAFKAIIQILAIIERLQNMSPQEQGQPAPREITAQEVAAIESTTQATYNAISSSIDKARAAWKKIIYESAMAHATQSPYLPVSQRFMRETITKAGFEIVDSAEPQGAANKAGYTIIGNKAKMVHEYVFTSRDGGDRASNREAANVLQQFLVGILPQIGPEALGKRRIFEIINEIFRLLSSYDLKLELEEGEGEAMNPTTQNAIAQLQEAFSQQMGELGKALQEHEQEIGGIADALEKINGFMAEMGREPAAT